MNSPSILALKARAIHARARLARQNAQRTEKKGDLVVAIVEMVVAVSPLLPYEKIGFGPMIANPMSS